MPSVLHTDTRTYLPEALSVRLARQRAERLLAEHGWGDEAAGNATLVVAELAANALRHAPGAEFRVALTFHADSVRIEVTDGDADHKPRIRRAADDACDGRGLLLVESLSTEWGTILDTAGAGKTVWSVVSRPAPG